MRLQSLGREGPLEEGMATHSSILAWRIPWTEEPGGLPSMANGHTCLMMGPQVTHEQTRDTWGRGQTPSSTLYDIMKAKSFAYQ